jgi:serine/threonine-protein kinase
VIERLGVTILGSEREVLEDAPTENMEAYQLYLQAKNLTYTRDVLAWDRLRVELFEGATRLDPEFVEAWAALSQHHSVFYYQLVDRTDERLSKARLALQHAEEIDKHHFRTHLARGAYYYYGFREYDQALEEFLAATEIVPNEAAAREMVGYIYRRQGKWTEALEHMKAAFELNPQEDNIASNIAGTYTAMREFEEALRYHDRAIELDPESASHVFEKAATIVRWRGDLDAALEIMSEKPKGNPLWYHFGNMFLHYWSRDYAKAREHALQWDTSTDFFRVCQIFTVSIFDALEKGPEAAHDELEEARDALQAFLKQAPSNDTVRSFLSRVLALLGENEAAVNEAKLTVDLVAKDRFEGPERMETMAQVYAHVGRHDEAIDILERLLKTVYDGAITPHMLAINPAWDPLREHPRFQKLLPPKNI